MTQRLPLRQLWPRQIGNQCLVMLVIGALLGWLLPGQIGWLTPLKVVFLQASQIVVMPFLICELVVGFGGLRPGSIKGLLAPALSVLAGLWLVAGTVVTLLPLALPKLVTSEFFHRGLFEQNQPVDLLKTYLPDNIFSAMAADNFPAVVLYSCLLGLLLQGLPERERLLEPLEVIRQLFGQLNRLVARIIPYGILALVATNVAQLDLSELLRMQAYLQLSLIAFVLLSLLCWFLIIALTPLSPKDLWQIVKGPLALTASSTNLLIALPLLISNLKEVLGRWQPAPGASQNRSNAGLELAPLVSLGYSLPTLGQVASLLFLPFAGWYVDKPLGLGGTVHMLLTAIPASVSGLKSTLRQELIALGLPVDLLQLVYLNGEWLYRFEKVLALEGLVVLAVLVYTSALGSWRLRLWRLLASVLASLGLAMGLGWASRVSLAATLKSSYHNDDRLLALVATQPTPPLAPLTALRSEAVSLSAILRRRSLRVGVRADGLPWAFRNRKGQLVGYDLDLIKRLASTLGVGLQVREGSMSALDSWLDRQEIDLAIGGIQATPERAIRHQISRGYQTIHLALVVPDDKVSMIQGIQGLGRPTLGRPLKIAVTEPSLVNTQLEDQIRSSLVGAQGSLVLDMLPLDSKNDFFSAVGQRTFDALLTSAEGGSAWSILHPKTTLLVPFGRELGGRLVVLVAGEDRPLTDYLNTWLAQEEARGTMASLFAYWIELKP